jgi:probable HAF family extracellular repeat protein
MIDLGTLGGTFTTTPIAVSADGAVIVGSAGLRAVSWVNGSTTAIPLETLGGTSNFAIAVSADGTVIVGESTLPGDTESRAVSWVNGSTTAIALGTLGGTSSSARAVSSNGNVIVGEASILGNAGIHAASWVNGSTTAIDLGTLGGSFSTAAAVSANGNVIVGEATTGNAETRAASWVNGSTTAIDLGTLGGNVSRAFAVSANGNVIVGEARTTGNAETRAAAWVNGSTTATNLGTLGGNFGRALAVSADGTVIVGDATTENRELRAFIWRTQMQDFENLRLSFPVLANDTEIAVTQQQAVTQRLMEQTCLAEAGQSCITVGGWLANTSGNAAANMGSSTSGVATLTYGWGLDGQITLGGSLNLSNTDLGSNGFDMGNAVGASLWAEYSQGGLSRTGWQAGAAIGYGRESGDITRGRGLANVMLATGAADLTTTAARATLGYGFQQQDWLITPSLTLAHYRTTRGAYAESGADFNAIYDELSTNRTTATLAVSGEYAVSDQGTLSLGAGLEHDLSADRVLLTGTSTVPVMEAFAVSSTIERRNTRGFLDIGYTHDLGNNRTLLGSARVGQAAFGSAPQVGLGITYAMRF